MPALSMVTAETSRWRTSPIMVKGRPSRCTWPGRGSSGSRSLRITTSTMPRSAQPASTSSSSSELPVTRLSTV